MIETELKLVLVYFLTGVVITFIFDIFRSLRKCMKTGSKLTNIEDTIFWIIAFIIIIIVMFKFNDFSLRFYLFCSFAIGCIVYVLTISKYMIQINVKIITFMKKIVKNICFFIKSLL